MKQPIRILDDPATPSTMRADLLAAREATPPFDSAAALARLQNAMAQAPATSLRPRVIGGAGAAIVAGAIVAYSVLRGGSSDAPPSSPPPASVTAPEAAPKARDEVPTVPLESLPSVPREARGEPGEPAGSGAKSQMPKEAPASTDASTSAPSSAGGEGTRADRLREEMDQLARIRALGASAPESALRLADEGNVRFRDGVFYEEREALAIEALARLGRRDEARARAEAYVKRFPGGPATEKVKLVTGMSPIRRGDDDFERIP